MKPHPTKAWRLSIDKIAMVGSDPSPANVTENCDRLIAAHEFPRRDSKRWPPPSYPASHSDTGQRINIGSFADPGRTTISGPLRLSTRIQPGHPGFCGCGPGHRHPGV